VANVTVIGAGAMGLAAAYYALKAGHDVVLYEGDSVPGGMAAHFDFGGLSIERFYHFVCKADQPLFDLMDELGIGDKMVWRETSMGYFIDGKHYPWGDPISLLTFPKLSPISKIRYGLQAFTQTKRSDWSVLENVNAKDWLIKGLGSQAYDMLWRRLLDLKFCEYADDISAAWIATRIKRVGTSRKSILQEELGHIEGGSQTLVDALVDAIKQRGGTIKLGVPVEEIVCEDSVVKGVKAGGEFNVHDYVISTVPTPFVPKLIPGLPAESKSQYEAINNIGVVCVVLKLKKPVTKNFWLNINDDRIEVPGFVEFSNLRSFPDTVLYAPYYMPQTHPKFSNDSDAFVEETFKYVQMINPNICKDDLLDSKVGRLRYAQPVCEPGFASKIPPVQTPIKGLQVADTCFYYPEDRGISESVNLAKAMAAALK
jgi:protoporphyrinogen oxidase